MFFSETGKKPVMRTLANLLLLSISMTLLSACAEGLKLRLGKPYALDLQPPPGPPEYQQGWDNGCRSAISGYGSQFNKVFFDFEQDSTQVLDPVYQQVWHDAYDYCRVFIKTTMMHGYNNYNRSGMFF